MTRDVYNLCTSSGYLMSGRSPYQFLTLKLMVLVQNVLHNKKGDLSKFKCIPCQIHIINSYLTLKKVKLVLLFTKVGQSFYLTSMHDLR